MGKKWREEKGVTEKRGAEEKMHGGLEQLKTVGLKDKNAVVPVCLQYVKPAAKGEAGRISFCSIMA